MSKVIPFPAPVPEKFGHQRVAKRKGKSSAAGQLDLFATSAGRVVRMNPLGPFESALLHDDRHNISEAKNLYLKAIELEDSVADAYCNLGILESLEGNHAQAITCFSKSLQTDPRHSEAHYNLANLYADVRDYTLAKLHYGVAIEIDPEFPNSYFNLALTHAMVREYSAAIASLEKYKDLVSPAEAEAAQDLINVIRQSQL